MSTNSFTDMRPLFYEMTKFKKKKQSLIRNPSIFFLNFYYWLAIIVLSINSLELKKKYQNALFLKKMEQGDLLIFIMVFFSVYSDLSRYVTNMQCFKTPIF